MAAKDVDPLANAKSYEMGAQSWVENCGVCHVGGGQMEYDRDLNWYSAASKKGDAFVLKYATTAANGGDGSYVTPSAGYMSMSNKAEMDCLMCHLKDSNPGAAWLKTLGCNGSNKIGPLYDPACIGSAGGNTPYGRTLNTTLATGVTEYDMFNRNFALKQYQPGLAAAMGAGAKGVWTAGKLTGVDWGTATVPLSGTRIADVPKSENCAVCHARVDDTMGLPNMMGMKTGYGNFDLLYRPGFAGIPEGMDGRNSDLDTDNGAGAANDDFYQEFGCKTGMGKRAHKVSAAGDAVGTNGRYGMTPMVPSTMNPALPGPHMGDTIPGKMPDIDVHNMAGMQCATCHYNLGTEQDGVVGGKGYIDIPARTSHGVNYPAERVYGQDHIFAQGDSFPDTKSKNNLDNSLTCEACHITHTHPHEGLANNALVAPTPTHAGFPQVHFEKIACATCHIPETYSAPGRLKYRDWSAGFWHQAQKNVLDWNFDLMTGSHNTVPSMHRWAVKDANLPEEPGVNPAKIYPVLPSILPTWFQELPNHNVVRDDSATVCVDNVSHQVAPPFDVTGLLVGAACNSGKGTVALYSSINGSPSYGSLLNGPVKTRDTAKVAEWVRDNGTDLTATGKGDGVCGPVGTCVGGVNAGNACTDRTDCTKFDFRLNGANTFPLFDGFQLADGLEIDTKAKVDAMLAGFAAKVNGSDAPHATFLNMVEADFDVTHGVVPEEWALGGSKRGGCVSCHSSKAPQIVDKVKGLPQNFYMVANPNYNENSVGFFEGYVQPVDKAGMMVGGYDLIKNWTAMFADFDCTAMCGMGQQGDAAFFNPMTGEKNDAAACTSGSMFQNLGQCVGMMTQTFDAAMGFPSGTAMQMGMYDGIAGLQGFTINTLQTMGTLDCNPFGGPISFSPIPDMNGNGLPDGNVNSCMPAPGMSPGFDSYGLNAGVCTGAAAPNPGHCTGGFRNSGACMNNADCRGAMTDTAEVAHNPMGLILSRKEVRSRQKIDLQQGYKNNLTSNPNNIRWAMAVTQNPGNPAHVASWDQANYCIDRNPALYPNPFMPGAISCRSIPYTEAECNTGTPKAGTWMGVVGGAGFCSSPQSPDGQRHIMNMVQANQFLGYTADELAKLMTPATARYRSSVHTQHVTVQGMHCSACHYAGASNVDKPYADGYAVVSDPSVPAKTFVYTARPGSAPVTGTCATACHDVAKAALPSDVATARISSQHASDKNFTVQLDGSKSACYHVDPVTGVTTPGTTTYAWTLTGSATTPAKTLVNGVTSLTAPGISCGGNVAKCDAVWPAAGTNNVTLAVTCSAGSTSNSSTVGVTGFAVQAIAQQDLGFTVTPAGSNVTVAFDATPTHRADEVNGLITTSYAEVLDGVVISWANFLGDITDTKLVVPFTNPISQTHTYAAGTHSILVRTAITTTKTVSDLTPYKLTNGTAGPVPRVTVTTASNHYDYNASTDAVLGGIVTP